MFRNFFTPTSRIYFESPTGASVSLRIKRTQASAEQGRFYIATIDVAKPIVTSKVTSTLCHCLGKMKPTEYLLLGICSGPKVDLGSDFSPIGENRESTIYRTRKKIDATVISDLSKMEYGFFFIIALNEDFDFSPVLSTLVDLESSANTLRDSIEWGIAYYNEIGVRTILSIDHSVVTGEILGAISEDFIAE